MPQEGLLEPAGLQVVVRDPTAVGATGEGGGAAEGGKNPGVGRRVGFLVGVPADVGVENEGHAVAMSSQQSETSPQYMSQKHCLLELLRPACPHKGRSEASKHVPFPVMVEGGRVGLGTTEGELGKREGAEVARQFRTSHILGYVCLIQSTKYDTRV